MKADEMTDTRREFTFVALVLTALGLILTACGGKDTVLTVPTGAQAGDLTLEPCTFKWDDVEYEADCGTLIVPENRAKADSRLIALPVMRVRATGESPTEPIFWLAGGPGDSNMGFKPPAWLLLKHDIVMVGYRGVDGSSVLDCPEVAQALIGVGGDLLSAESRANMGDAMVRCAERLQAQGVDLEGYTMLEVVEDMEAARLGSGYERVNLLSSSYGTRLAQIYAWQYPERIHRSVMMGVNPPGHFIWEPENIDSQLAYYARLCAQDAGCSTRTNDLAETMRKVAHDMPRRWLFLQIDPGKVKMGSFFPGLVNPNSAALVFDAYIAAEQGDPSGLALASLASDFLPPPITWGDFIAKAASAGDFDPLRDYATEMDPPGSILGSPWSLLFAGSLKGWPTNPIRAEFRQVQPSDVETLLVSGSIDFSTPAEFATDELLPYLTNGQQIILAERGHQVADLFNVQPEGTERLLTSFYNTGVADDSLYTYAPMDFSVSLGFPALAKIMLGIVLLLIAVAVMVVRFVVRRLRHRLVRTKP